MTIGGLFRKALNAGLLLYLVTHGVSVPPGSEASDLARYVFSFALSWLTTAFVPPWGPET